MTKEEQKAVEEFTEMNLTKKGLYHYNDMQDAFLIGLFKGEKMQPSLPSNLDKAAEDSWAAYEYRESPNGLYSTCYMDGFKACAEWMAGQGVSMQVNDDTEWEEVDSFIHKNVDGRSIIQIRK